MVALALYLALFNLAAFGLFGWDKRAAVLGNWRIPESTLLLAAALGGSPGALLGQKLFRHKTQKQPFKTLLWLIVVVQTGLATWLVVRILPII